MTLLVNPPARWGASIAELAVSNKVVLFGGKTGDRLLSDTYTWDGTAWTLLNITGPSARCDAAMSYDGTYVSLVGGNDGIANLSDTWSYNVGSGWFKQNITNIENNGFTVPTLLTNASMAYQSGAGEAILFGGSAQYQRHYVLDTWSWQAGNPGTWMLLSPVAWPNARERASFASSTTNAVMFGGKNFDGPLSDTWKWNGTVWSKLTTVGNPSARYGASMIFDASTNLFVLFGGITTDGFNGETWTFNLGTLTWTKVSAATAPAPRAESAMAYNSHTSNSVLFGGLGYAQSYGDTWVFNSTALTWTLQ